MNDKNEPVVLCGASSYNQKFYLNPEFSSLPDQIKKELQILCVLYTADVGGVLVLQFDPEGNLEFQVSSEEADGTFDEIGSALKIKQIRQEQQDLLESLELYFRTFYLGEE